MSCRESAPPRLIFVELLQGVWKSNIYSVDTKASTKDKLVFRVPSDTEPRLKILEVARIQSARGVNDGSHSSRHGIDGGRTEIADQAVSGMKWTLGGPSETEVQRQRARELPIVLKVEAVNCIARQPSSGVAGKIRLPHIT